MSKRKILTLALSVCMIAILAVGGTLAYFTSEDQANNTFTMGNVKIKLEEEFTRNSELFPGVDVNKDVYVKNTGSVDAYVRVHIAIPADMDDGNPSFAAYRNLLHFNFTKASYADGQWSWLPTYSAGEGYKGNGAGNWNYYTTKIEGTDYAVYVVTYRTALEPEEQTKTQALDKVYLDTSVNAKASDDGKFVTYSDNKGNSVKLPATDGKVFFDIKVYAEGTQTAGFTNAFDALNAAFGTPGSTGYVSPWNK